MIETKTIKYESYELNSRCLYNDKSTVHFTLLFYNQIGASPVHVFTCTLRCLFREEAGYIEGDYYQGFINREDRDGVIAPEVSLTRIVHEILRRNRVVFPFIKNLYSTEINSGNGFTEAANNFWRKQVENNLAVWSESKGRYRAILE